MYSAFQTERSYRSGIHDSSTEECLPIDSKFVIQFLSSRTHVNTPDRQKLGNFKNVDCGFEVLD
jgi:hypothetical protein